MKHKNSKRKAPENSFKDRQEDLRGDNRKLRKQVSQLQKEVRRLKNRDDGLQELIEEFGHIEEQAEIENFKVKMTCPHCHSKNVRLLNLRFDNSHYNCIDCGKTGPVK